MIQVGPSLGQQLNRIHCTFIILEYTLLIFKKKKKSIEDFAHPWWTTFLSVLLLCFSFVLSYPSCFTHGVIMDSPYSCFLNFSSILINQHWLSWNKMCHQYWTKEANLRKQDFFLSIKNSNSLKLKMIYLILSKV